MTAQSSMKIAAIVYVNLISLKPFQSNSTRELEFCGSLVLSSVRLQNKMKPLRRAKHLKVQANPILEETRENMIG